MKKIYSFIAMMLLSALSFTAQAATCKVYIDKLQAVSCWIYNGDYEAFNLTNAGDTPNIIEFDETKTKFFEFDPYNLNTGLYKILKNDVEIDLDATFNGEGYEVYDVKDGDVINIIVERPADILCEFTFVKGAEAIASVENDFTEEVYTLENNTFKAKPGDRIVLRPKKDVTITNATLNGKELEFSVNSGCYFFVAKEAKNEISIEAEAATGITFATKTINTEKIFNLQGVEMKGNKMPAGIYIINGKKAVVK